MSRTGINIATQTAGSLPHTRVTGLENAAQTFTGKTISGNDNTITDVPVSALAVAGTPDATTFLRGDGSWTAPAGGGSTFVGGSVWRNADVNGYGTNFTYNFNVVEYGDGFSFGVYTAPVDGIYHASTRVTLYTGTRTYLTATVKKNNSSATPFISLSGGSGSGYAYLFGERTFSLAAGDTLAVRVSADATVSTSGGDYFQVTKVG